MSKDSYQYYQFFMLKEDPDPIETLSEKTISFIEEYTKTTFGGDYLMTMMIDGPFGRANRVRVILRIPPSKINNINIIEWNNVGFTIPSLFTNECAIKKIENLCSKVTETSAICSIHPIEFLRMKAKNPKIML